LTELKGYIGLTDPDWHSFLSSQSKVDEVNFWQPHGGHKFRVLKSGEPFFFKLRAPFKAIAGFGFFQRFDCLPAWLAWDCFGEMNGASTFEYMIDRISRLRRKDEKSDPTGTFQIGCIMISAPVFFNQSEWIDPPADWPPTGIQQGKSYSMGYGEGRRVFLDCLRRAENGNHYWNVEPISNRINEPAERYGTPITVTPRLGQGLFSMDVREAYNGACAVTHEHSAPVLEAAHIRPFARGGEHKIENGLLLRRDVHRLFDLGYVTITPEYQFKVGNRLRDDYQNGRSYYELSNQNIFIPKSEAQKPSRELLDWHNTEIFKG
jgi:putative restriction endonuclease